MPISLIANVAIFENKLAIGRDDELLFKLPEDMAFFKNMTSTKTSHKMNIVLMGHSTYKSIPDKYRPLAGRINLVLTNDILKVSTHILSVGISKLEDDKPYFINMDIFKRFFTQDINVFVIGGATIYNYFLSDDCPIELRPEKLYITHVLNPGFKSEVKKPNKFMDQFYGFKILSYSERVVDKKDFRIITYVKASNTSQEYKYLALMDKILTTGIKRQDRTETGTLSLFGEKIEFDISQSIPMMTTRSISFKAIVEELLWFCRGDTDAKVLQARGVKIWNGNSTREFLNKQDLHYYPEGVLGPVYGHQWRHHGSQYDPRYADVSNVPNSHDIGGFDQLTYVVNLLKTDPFSRRIVMSSWNPSDLSKQALPACHTQVQWYVEEIGSIKYLSCMFTMRSQDSIATAYNICSYSILTYILAIKCNMFPKKIIMAIGDAHIYSNNIDQVKEQLTRTPRPACKLFVDSSIKNKDWSEMSFKDFELIGYLPHPALKMHMAV